MELRVRARRPTSSSVCGLGDPALAGAEGDVRHLEAQRLDRRRARPTMIQQMRPTTASRIGRPISSRRWTEPQAPVVLVQRDDHHDRALVGADLHRDRDHLHVDGRADGGVRIVLDHRDRPAPTAAPGDAGSG